VGWVEKIAFAVLAVLMTLALAWVILLAFRTISEL
jgi:hypothetical protein